VLEHRRQMQRRQWRVATALSAACVVLSLLDSIFAHVVVRPTARLYTAAIDNADRSALFAVCASLMDCSLLIAVWGLALGVVVLRRQQRGVHSFRPIRLVAFVHSAVAGLTAVVLALAAILVAVVAVEVMWSKVRDATIDCTPIFRFVSAAEPRCLNSCATLRLKTREMHATEFIMIDFQLTANELFQI
jgi:hypothetical protein